MLSLRILTVAFNMPIQTPYRLEGYTVRGGKSTQKHDGDRWACRRRRMDASSRAKRGDPIPYSQFRVKSQFQFL